MGVGVRNPPLTRRPDHDSGNLIASPCVLRC